MERFKSLFNKPDEQDPFKKFAEANKQNIGPDTSLNVPETFKNAYDTTQDLRRKAIDKIAEQTDLGKDIPGVGPNEEYRNIARTGLDVILPDTSDLIPGGKLEHGAKAMFPMLGMAAKEGKLLKFPGKAEKTAEEMVQGLKKAESADLKLGSNLLNQPVLKTAEEKAAEQLPGAFGKVTTPNMGENISHQEIMDVLNKSPSYQQHIANRDLFKTNPEAYSDKKDYFIQKAREYLQNKKMGK